MAGVAYGSLPFQQQIAFFRNKENVLTDRWDDVWEAEHDASFMVAGANRVDLVADFREAVRAAVEDGETLDQFRRRFDSIVAKHGWDYNGGRNWRSRVIYETNLRQSYNAGRYAQQMALRTKLPYIQYHHSDAVQHPRPVHLGWNGMVLRADDPAWQAIYPANGWGCQCYTSSLSERDLRRLGKSGPDPSPKLKWIDALVGKRSPGGPHLVRTVEGIDPGFAYAPGASLQHWPKPTPLTPATPPVLQRTLERAAQDALRKSARLPAAAAEAALHDAFALTRAQLALDAGFAEFRAEALDRGQAAGNSYLVGLVDGAVLRELAARSASPAAAAIAVADDQVLAAVAAQLPASLRNARAVLWDAVAEQLLYVTSADGGVLVTRVSVTGALCEIRGTELLRDSAPLARYELLRGSRG